MELNLSKEQQLILLGLVASIVVGLGVGVYRHFAGSADRGIVIEDPKGEARIPEILVHVCGAVRREGVYKLKPADRLLEALEIAGGALPSADFSALNLAEAVKDGEKIIVPIKREIGESVSGDLSAARPSSSKSGRQAQEMVNINTANEEALDSLPGIGKSTAKKIVEYRRTNGPFTRIEQIMEIPRFGKSKFERIKDRITI